MPQLAIASDDPFLSWMPAGKPLSIDIGGDLAYSVPLAGAAKPARAFVAVCRR